MAWPFSWFSRRRSRAATVATAPGGGSTGPARSSDGFITVGGRRLSLDAPYLLPKDYDESNRLDLQHYMLKYVLGGNSMAPVGTPRSILDVGCGTGRWGAEMAQQFPGANVVGVDIAPPSVASVAVTQGQFEAPDNYTFVAADILKGLPFADSAFEFVHMRLVVLALPAADWPRVIAELVRVTAPGGWVELVDTTVSARSPGAEPWAAWARQMGAARGIDMNAGAQIGNLLRSAGLRDVQDLSIEIPIGPWGGRIGRLMQADALAGARALRAPVVDLAHLATGAEFDGTIARMEAEWGDPSIRATQPFYVAFGRRGA